MNIFPSWIELPALDVERAAAFYGAVLDLPPAEVYDDGTRRVAILFHGGDGKPGVSLNQTANFMPSRHGTLMYLRVTAPLAGYLARVTAAGGKVLEAETAMGTTSFYAIIEDTEGNGVALSYTAGEDH